MFAANSWRSRRAASRRDCGDEKEEDRMSFCEKGERGRGKKAKEEKKEREGRERARTARSRIVFHASKVF